MLTRALMAVSPNSFSWMTGSTSFVSKGEKHDHSLAPSSVTNRFHLFPDAQAAISHLFVRAICQFIVEYECAMRILEASGRDYRTGNAVMAGVYTLAGILCIIFPKKMHGYIVGIGTALLHIAIKFYFVFSGHEHYPYWPIVWITHCCVIIYFCVQAILASRRETA